MAKRILAILVLLFMIITAYCSCAQREISDITAARRPPHEQLDVVYIDDQAVALAGHPSDDLEMRALAVEAYELTNQFRDSQGLDTLAWSERLATDALVRAEEIEDLFSHTRPKDNLQWWTVDSEHMYGENLAQGYGDANSVVFAWINSPTHRENLEDFEFITCGIAAWRGEDGVIYIAQEFGY